MELWHKRMVPFKTWSPEGGAVVTRPPWQKSEMNDHQKKKGTARGFPKKSPALFHGEPAREDACAKGPLLGPRALPRNLAFGKARCPQTRPHGLELRAMSIGADRGCEPHIV